MDANSISLDVSQDELSPLRGKQPGDSCSLQNVELEVVSNDGKMLTANVVGVELGDTYGEEASGDESEGEAMPAPTPKKAVKPIAVIAIGAKTKE